MIKNLDKINADILDDLNSTIAKACHDVNRKFKCSECPYHAVCEALDKLTGEAMDNDLY